MSFVTKSLSPKLRNPYPAIGFEQAYTYIKLVAEKTNLYSQFDREWLMREGLRLTEKSGGRGDNIVSSLFHYGLLERIETDYHFTDLGIELVNTEPFTGSWFDVALRAIISPELYGILYSRFGLHGLPDNIDRLIEAKYKNITSENVTKIIKHYVGSLEFLERTSAVKTITPSSPTGAGSQKQHGRVNGDLVEIDLGDDLVLRLDKRAVLETYDLETERVRQKLLNN